MSDIELVEAVRRLVRDHPDLPATLERLRAKLTDDRLAALAEATGVPGDAWAKLAPGWCDAADLRTLHAGGAGWGDDGGGYPDGAFAFPEYDGRGRLCGLSLRALDGRKGAPSSAATGWRRGLIVPTNLPESAVADHRGPCGPCFTPPPQLAFRPGPGRTGRQHCGPWRADAGRPRRRRDDRPRGRRGGWVSRRGPRRRAVRGRCPPAPRARGGSRRPRRAGVSGGRGRRRGGRGKPGGAMSMKRLLPTPRPPDPAACLLDQLRQ